MSEDDEQRGDETPEMPYSTGGILLPSFVQVRLQPGERILSAEELRLLREQSGAWEDET